MEQCCLCGAGSDIHEESDGFFVKCTGSCGPYIITRRALKDLTKIFGRKQSAIDRVKEKREQDKERVIRISHDSVSFAP
jgi:hypothetical protein